MPNLDSQKMIAHLQAKWGGRACPMCDARSWNVADSVFQLLQFNRGGLTIGGPVVPVVPVVCENCGHTVLVNGIISGVVEAPPPPKQEEPK